ncbi:hypothetical protein BDZ45DRAFT_735649 [Acephala macrosclerotiorum]|nr:hypothetical protein BDZ45DRAFT_735649 [Acephala macrosclerotiorum]
MLATTISRSILVAAIIRFKAATALPTVDAEKIYPEVIPGPGLPSLAELNLTSAQLYNMPIPTRWAQPSGNGDLIVGAINKNYNG